jgi:hypothetical protein
MPRVDHALVSVIIPAHNSGAYLSETIDSVLGQTYPHREIIVVDDGSTDDTPARVKGYGGAVTYIPQAQAGVGAARNRGLAAARGDYVALLDHDDLWRPEKLAVQVEVASRHPASGMIVCDGVEFEGDTIVSPHLLSRAHRDALDRSPDGEVTGPIYWDLIRGDVIKCPAQTFIPRAVTERVGPLSSARNEATDFDYYLRISREYPVTVHRHSLVRWRYLPTSRSGPAERRMLQWGMLMSPVMAREARRGPPEHRPVVRAALRALVRRHAREAYYYGRRHDLAFARASLRQVMRHAPLDAHALAYLAACSVPDSVATLAGRAWRRLARRAGRG